MGVFHQPTDVGRPTAMMLSYGLDRPTRDHCLSFGEIKLGSYRFCNISWLASDRSSDAKIHLIPGRKPSRKLPQQSLMLG